MVVIHDPRCADYGSSLRPEQPARVVTTAVYLRETYPDWTRESPGEAAADDVLLLAHTRDHIVRLERPRDFDPDTPYFPGIGLHARRAVAAAVKAARCAYMDRLPAFSLMRPPGHHAAADQAMGFCYLNQIAIAALVAKRDLGVDKVAVWDFDAHHGNGTEDILLGRDGFLFASVHQSPCYPGTGLRSTGNCRNWQVSPHAPRAVHMEALRESFEAVTRFEPDLILVSAGFDAYAEDPITEMTLEAEDFAALGGWLRKSGLPAAAVLEGGYSRELPQLVGAFLGAWAAQ
jgi:acetoin utilization deacetylase AcuC-like enzyme